MKKLKLLLAALALTAGIALLPSKKTTAQDMGGHWIVTIYSFDHWTCTNGGGVCCPSWDC